jgi:hypothetical protein
MHGAWESAGNFLHEQQAIHDYAWFGGNSTYQLHRVRTLQKGIPGVYDLIGNAAESVLIQPTEAGRMLRIGNFGCSFRDRRISSNLTVTVQPDMLRNNWSGMRIVLAPGNMDYFESNWFGGQNYQVQHMNTIYETLGGPECSWTPQTAADWSRLIGCQQAMLHDLQLRQKLFNSSQRLRELPVLLGASGCGEDWFWYDHQEVKGGEWFDTLKDKSQDLQKKFLI